MSIRPSKSELESALSGKKQFHSDLNSGNKNKSHAPMMQNNNPRRQQVIGGDLTGVSSRHKKNWRTKLSQINIVNWVAGFIVLLILAAFFWPTTTDESIKEVVEKSQAIKTESFYTESRIDEAPVNEIDKETPFSRETDLQRASIYREQDQQQKKIQSLLSKASEYSNKGQYTVPKNQNAIELYNAVLQIDPRNSAAKSGIEQVKNRFLQIGSGAIENGNSAQVKTALNKLSSIDNESDQYLELSNAFDDWQKQSQIANFMKLAESAKRKENYILPSENSALYYIDNNLCRNFENFSSLLPTPYSLLPLNTFRASVK